MVVPALLADIDLQALLARVDGVLASGSATNVHPGLYGVEPTAGHEPFDPARDSLSIALLSAAIEAGVPTLAVCRGHQELNVAYGGSLATEIQEGENRMDHRAPQHPTQDERYAPRHPVAVEANGLLRDIVDADEIAVNSLHRQAIDRLGEGLIVEARAPDGTIEAVSVAGSKAFALGVQWHPEYWAASDPASRAIFEAFAKACRARRDGR